MNVQNKRSAIASVVHCLNSFRAAYSKRYFTNHILYFSACSSLFPCSFTLTLQILVVKKQRRNGGKRKLHTKRVEHQEVRLPSPSFRLSSFFFYSFHVSLLYLHPHFVLLCRFSRNYCFLYFVLVSHLYSFTTLPTLLLYLLPYLSLIVFHTTFYFYIPYSTSLSFDSSEVDFCCRFLRFLSRFFVVVHFAFLANFLHS